MHWIVRSAALAVIVGFIAIGFSAVQAADDDGLQFFEQKIRPVLAQHCYSCHSAAAHDMKKLQGGLFLDTAAGGDSGPALVKGKSGESRLIKALKFDGLEMPPAGKLPDEVVADFARWIDLGAPDPRGGDAPARPKREININEGKQWWAFQPLGESPPPDASRPIDGFLKRAQAERGLKPNHPASREKLIRRAYFDLVGLPPTPEQVAAFVADASPNAFEKVVDELLASSGYGERWARHWLDAARFAESGGYEFDGFRPGAYHYRDWVIRALNSDMPYDQFLRMQLAGDLLRPESVDGAAATGFLVAGPFPGQITAKTVERIRYDQLDDMMMTIGGSMLGLTLGCVRCHEHKYDPIPHQDYYSVVSAFATTSHGPRTLDLDPAATEQAQANHLAAQQPLMEALQKFARDELPGRFATWRAKELDKQPDATRWLSLEPLSMWAERSYLKSLPGGLVVHDGPIAPGVKLRQDGKERQVGGDERYQLSFQTHQKNIQALRLDALTNKTLPARGPGLAGDGGFQLVEIIATARPLDPADTSPAQTLKLKPVSSAFADDGQPLDHAVDGKPETAWIVRTTARKDNGAIFEFDPPLAGFALGTELSLELKFRDVGLGRMRVALSVEPNPATWAGDVAPQHVAELRTIVGAHGANPPEAIRPPLARWFAPFDAEASQLVQKLRDHITAAPRPNFSEVYTTVPGGQDVYFLRRGEVDNKQGKAEPGFLQVLLRGESSPPSSPIDPRVALANWIADVERGAAPLVARVIANRLWQHHFGVGIVATANDFGVQGQRPSHPELLEYLARELVRGGWKLKPLHKMMLLSDAYQQSHEVDAENQKLDPENRLLWHYRPRRLEAESIRDAILAVGGNLDGAMYGPSVLDNSLRRSVYLRVKRSELLPIMTMFDAPEPTQSIGERSVTTVPTQALAMMNSPFVRQQAERLFARVKPTQGAPLATAVDRGYQIAFARSPTEAERATMLAFIEQQRAAAGAAPDATDRALVEFCQALLCLNEFVYVD